MLRKGVDELFAEYADAYASGRRPRAEQFLRQAGEDADELAGMIDRFLGSAPRRAAAPEDSKTLARWLTATPVDPPLLAVRKRMALKREQVVDALVRDLKIDPAKRGKVGRYYHELETGQLDPGRVERSVFGVLERIFDQALPRLEALAKPLRAEPAFFREADVRAVHSRRTFSIPEPEPDEVDALFTGAEPPSIERNP